MNKLHSALILVNVIIGGFMSFDWTTLGLDPGVATKVAGVVLLVANLTKLGLNATGNGATGIVSAPPADK